jgi:hypothetical protein
MLSYCTEGYLCILQSGNPRRIFFYFHMQPKLQISNVRTSQLLGGCCRGSRWQRSSGSARCIPLPKSDFDLPTLCASPIRNIDSTFAANHVTCSITKFHWALSKLPESLMYTMDTIGPLAITDSYGELQNIQLQSYSLSSAQKTARLLDHPGLGSKNSWSAVWGFCAASCRSHSNSSPATCDRQTSNRLGF